MKNTHLLILCAVVALVLIAIPAELHNDPRLYMPVFALDVALLVWLWLDYRRWKRKFLRELEEMERRHGPDIYTTLREELAKRRRRS